MLKPVELTEEQKKIRDFFASRMFLTDEQKQQIAHGNAERIYKLK